jgi:FlaG/FlaF family flagellin (archaellin)
MNKKAISTLVATVLLVLITIAAVGIIWGAIMPIIRSNLETSQKCSAADLRVNTESGYTYQTGNDVYIQVSRGPSTIVLNGMQIKVIKSTGESVMNYTGAADVPGTNADKTYQMKLPFGDTAKRVGIAPIIALGNTNFTCPMNEIDMPK